MQIQIKEIKLHDMQGGKIPSKLQTIWSLKSADLHTHTKLPILHSRINSAIAWSPTSAMKLQAILQWCSDWCHALPSGPLNQVDWIGHNLHHAVD